VVQLDLQHRVTLAGVRQQLRQPQVVGVGQRPDPGAAGDFALQRAGVWAAAMTDCASGSSLRPAGVSVMPPEPRSNSGTASSSSSALICAERAGWLTWSFSAARVRCSVSATVAKPRS
jgi:hypothetical protein